MSRSAAMMTLAINKDIIIPMRYMLEDPLESSEVGVTEMGVAEMGVATEGVARTAREADEVGLKSTGREVTVGGVSAGVVPE